MLKTGHEPPVILDIVITSDIASLAQLTLSKLKLHIGITSENNAFGNITTNVADGKLHAYVKTTPEKETHTVVVNATLSHANMRHILEVLHVKNTPVKGTINVTLSMKAIGNTLQEWASSTWGNVNAMIRDGHISRLLFRIISTDVRTILGKDQIDLPMPCLKAAIAFKNGLGNLSPFWVETMEGNIMGSGTINLSQQSLDLFFQTDSKSTPALAFNVPIHIIGKFDSPHIGPSVGSKPAMQFHSVPEVSCLS